MKLFGLVRTVENRDFQKDLIELRELSNTTADEMQINIMQCTQGEMILFKYLMRPN